MTTTTTKRDLGKVPAGERDLVSGKVKGGRTQIKEALAEVRAVNEQAHAERMDACTAAAEGIVLTDAGPVDTDKAAGKSKGKPAKRVALTSRAKMGGGRKSKAAPAAEPKSNKEKLQAKRTARAGRFDWSKLPADIDHAAADAYAEQLCSGVGVTPRHIEDTLGLNLRQRTKIDEAMYAQGRKLHHRRNPDRDKADKLTVCLYWSEARQPS